MKIQESVDKEIQDKRCSHCGGNMPPITLAAILAVVDETYRRNMSGENWHSRVRDSMMAKFGDGDI